MTDVMEIAKLPGTRSRYAIITAFTLAYSARYFAKKSVHAASNIRRTAEEGQFLDIIRRISTASDVEAAVKACHDLVSVHENTLAYELDYKYNTTMSKARLAIAQLFRETVPLHPPFQKVD